MSRPDPWLLCDPYCAQFKCYHEEEIEMNPTNIEPVTEAELARVLELDAKATPGPWDAARMVDEETGDPLTPAQLVEYFTNSIAKSATESGGHEFYFVHVEKDDGPADVCHTGNGPTSAQNSLLIAEYRTLTPRLARELAAARAAITVKDAALKDLLATARNSSWAHITNATPDDPCRCKECSMKKAHAALNTHTHEIENATLRKISHTHE